jgi:hypothetical protein
MVEVEVSTTVEVLADPATRPRPLRPARMIENRIFADGIWNREIEEIEEI